MPLTDDDKKWLTDTFVTKEELRDMETRLLTAFQRWASPVEMRQRTHAAAFKAVDAEIEYLQDRVKKLEEKPITG